MYNNKIIILQQMIDIWYDKWIGFISTEEMINYAHMLGSYHTNYVRKKRNFYHYSK